MNPAGPTGAAINALGADPGTEATFAEPGSYGSNEAGDDTYSTGVDGDANETGASGDAGNMGRKRGSLACMRSTRPLGEAAEL